MATKAQIKAVTKYNKANTMQVLLRLNKKTDADILEALSKVKSKQGFIKYLIRQHIKRENLLKTRINTQD